MSNKEPILCPHCNQPINPAQLLKAQDVSKKSCQVCGKIYKGSKKSKFCSNACRCKAYRSAKS